MDIENLIADLSKEAYGSDIEDLLLDVATAIETLRAENEKLRAELEQAREERDSAISDLTCIARTHPVELCDDLVCQYCKH